MVPVNRHMPPYSIVHSLAVSAMMQVSHDGGYAGGIAGRAFHMSETVEESCSLRGRAGHQAVQVTLQLALERQ